MPMKVNVKTTTTSKKDTRGDKPGSKNGRPGIVLTFLLKILGKEAIEQAEKRTTSPCYSLF